MLQLQLLKSLSKFEFRNFKPMNLDSWKTNDNQCTVIYSQLYSNIENINSSDLSHDIITHTLSLGYRINKLQDTLKKLNPDRIMYKITFEIL